MKKLSISTAGAVNLDLEIGTNLVDSFFISDPARNKPRDLLAEPYSSLVEALNFGALIYPAVGQIARWFHPPEDGKGSGYNARLEDFTSQAEMNETQGGVFTVPFTDDFATLSALFAEKQGATLNICANIYRGTYEELSGMIKLFRSFGCKVKKVVFGAEITTFMTADEYSTIVTEWIARLKIDFPKITPVLYDALTRVNTRVAANLHAVVKSFVDVPIATQYMQIGDEVKLDTNMDSNLTKLQEYNTVTFPANIKKFLSDTGNKKILYGEVLLEDIRLDAHDVAKPQYINNTLLGDWQWAQMYMGFIRNQANIDSFYQMSLRNLIKPDNTVTENYNALVILNSLFKGNRKVTKLTIEGMTGVEGVSVSEGNTHFMLLSNYTDATVYADEVYVDGIKVSLTFNHNGRTGFNWNGVPNAFLISAPLARVPACGFTLIDFNTTAVA